MESYQEPDYKELYFSLFRASEKAIRILIQAQQECESRFSPPGRRTARRNKKGGWNPASFLFYAVWGQKVRSIRPAIARI